MPKIIRCIHWLFKFLCFCSVWHIIFGYYFDFSIVQFRCSLSCFKVVHLYQIAIGPDFTHAPCRIDAHRWPQRRTIREAHTVNRHRYRTRVPTSKGTTRTGYLTFRKMSKLMTVTSSQFRQLIGDGARRHRASRPRWGPRRAAGGPRRRVSSFAHRVRVRRRRKRVRIAGAAPPPRAVRAAPRTCGSVPCATSARAHLNNSGVRLVPLYWKTTGSDRIVRRCGNRLFVLHNGGWSLIGFNWIGKFTTNLQPCTTTIQWDVDYRN